MSNLRDVMQGIYEKHGRLTPQLVVDEARSSKHPLHHRFDWNDRTAAESYRREQAAEMIRRVRVVYRSAEEGDPSGDIRAWHSVRDGGEYEPLENVVEDPVLQTILLRDMEREWKALFRRYNHMEEFLALVAKDLVLVS